MFSLLLLWTLCNTSPMEVPVGVSSVGDTIVIRGSCWDVTTGMDLKVQVSALVDGRKFHLSGSRDAHGFFDVAIPVTASGLVFESKGYRPLAVPMTVLGKPREKEVFKITMPMLALDSQQIVSLYIPEENEAKVIGQVEKAVQTHFEVRDAYMRKLLTAEICLLFPQSGQTYCLNTDSLRAPIASFVGALDKMEVKVTAAGYEPYQGSLKKENVKKGDLLYQIKLLKSIEPLLALTFHAPETLDVEYVIEQNNTFVTRLPPINRKPWTNLEMKNVRLGTYSLKAGIVGESTILHEEGFTVRSGLNFKAITVTAPLGRSDNTEVSIGDHQTVRSFDHVTLYFDQSSYLLGTKTKLTLDSISGVLSKMPDAKVSVTGHTDNVGKHVLNVRLSEYRARVVANYLRGKGIQQQQIDFDWQGPDFPVAENDSEQNKMKNRRVEVQISGD